MKLLFLMATTKEALQLSLFYLYAVFGPAAYINTCNVA